MTRTGIGGGESSARCARLLLAIILVTGLAVTNTAVGGTVLGESTWVSGNGHVYAIVELPEAPWATAAADVELLLPGYHLVTVSSEAEEAFIEQLLVDVTGSSGWEWWLGGFQDVAVETDPAADWQWVTGEPWIYTDWRDGEPNDAGGVEDQLVLDNGAWNDEGTALGIVRGYIAELGRFDDVPAAYWAFDFVESLWQSGVTGGCGDNNFCPEAPITRAQMAVFIVRAMHGSAFVPPPAAGNVFLDVGATDFAAAYIEQLYRDGISGGCGNNNFCPGAPITRAQMAVFLLRAIHGPGYLPPPATGVFDDVDLAYWAVAWIEQLAAEGITGGCGGGDYCPDAPVTRAQMAVFMDRSFVLDALPPAEPSVSVGGDIKQLVFSWSEIGNADYYRLLENADGHSGFTQVGEDIPAGTFTVTRDIAVHLFDWINAQYIIEACNAAGCSSSDVTTVYEVMLNTIGYFKASNAWVLDKFGGVIALSADGETLAVGVTGEASSATGIDGDQNDRSAPDSGAVYLFRSDGSGWIQQAYIKASNSESYDRFGESIGLSKDGNTLAVGADGESSNATGINGNETNNEAPGSGAVYLFRFDGSVWSQHAYIKASNTEAYDVFGIAVALSDDGATLAVGAEQEDSAATGINGDQQDNSSSRSGAVYVFELDGESWSQKSYIKASNNDPDDRFGSAVALGADGKTLAISSKWEDSAAFGVNGDQTDNSITDNGWEYDIGAVYIFRFTGLSWSQQAYVKPINTAIYGGDVDLRGDRFGKAITLSADGNTLAVGAIFEDGAVRGIDGSQQIVSAVTSGAVYLYHFNGNVWNTQSYIKASNAGGGDMFGYSVSLAADGKTLVVGAAMEDSGAMGIGGDEFDASAGGAGAAYLFQSDEFGWRQEAYIKAPNTYGGFFDGDEFVGDSFGSSVAISEDGRTLAVGSKWESSSATGVNGDLDDDSRWRSGAVYLY
jgi:hypothetical protein